MFTINDFRFDNKGVTYVGDTRKFCPEKRSGRLTKFDLAQILDVVTRYRMHWVVIYDAFEKHFLIEFLRRQLDSSLNLEIHSDEKWQLPF